MINSWWSLPRAAPILLRHLLAYAELAEEDLQRFSRVVTARLIALAIALVGALFTLAMICTAVIAAAWDTSHRLAAILWMLGIFAVVTLIAIVIAVHRSGEEQSMFASVRREWSQDRVILDRLLAGASPHPHSAASADGQRGTK